MKKVRILTENSRIPNFFTHPVRKNIRRLKARGYDVTLVSRLVGHRLDSDILGLVSSRFSAWWVQPETIYAFIEKARTRAGKIIWFDDNDSTGVTHFELLPHIDLYLKKQLLKDKTLYCRSFYGDRLFTDFYHRLYGIVDQTPLRSRPLDLTLAHKVHLSWHIGLGDMAGDILPQKINRLRYYMPARYPKRLFPANLEKPIDLMFRGCRKYGRQTVSFHRETIGALLDAMVGVNGALQGRVSIRRYRRESRQAKIIISPFGWGEIGVRDFEAWMCGAALMKPDMSHLETWPDVFIPGVTYFPLNWGFENLATGVEQLLHDEQMRLDLAAGGQSAYRRMISNEGMEAFCDWFVQQIEK